MTTSIFYTAHITQIDADTYLAVSPDLPHTATGDSPEEVSAKLANLAAPRLPLVTLLLPTPDLLPQLTYNLAMLAPH